MTAGERSVPVGWGRLGDEVLNEWVVAAAAGDDRAVDRLIAEIRPDVLRYCRGRLGRSPWLAAEDVAQEVCLAVCAALPRYRNCGRPFLAFVYKIAANKVSDAFRRSAALGRLDLAPDVPDHVLVEGPEQSVLRTERTRLIAALLAHLPERQREILVLRVVVGLTAQRTADAIGSSPGAVRVAQSRAMSRLRTILLDDKSFVELLGSYRLGSAEAS